MLRRSADTQEKSIVATFYQAGNGIFDLFDKVLVLCEGREIYYGPTSLARGYFEDMGFVCTEGANVADFLTSVAVPTERIVREGFEHMVPNLPEEFEERYKQSYIFARMTEHLSSVDGESLSAETEELKKAVQAEKARSMPLLSSGQSVYTVSLYRQTLACTQR